LKAVIYARYSSDTQREESIEGQIRECTEFANKQSITILSTYIDRAFSAKTDARPEFQRMIKDSEKHLFDIVIVWKLDRFARNRFDSAHNKMILRKNGVKVVSATEAIAEDSTGILLESMLEGYAEYYSAELSEKVNRGMTENALKCKFNGGIIPMGYTISSEQYYQVDPVSAPMVLEMFTLYDKGATMLDLVNIMNERGIRSALGGKYSLNNINYLLKNRRYTGEYRYRDIVTPNAIPVIVPQDLFDRVQERMVKNKKAPARAKAVDESYLLTTKLFCGLDGVYMAGESGVGRTKKVHRYYKCVNTKKKRTCTKKSVKKDLIENLVIHETMEMIKDDNVVNYIVDLALELESRESSSLPLLSRQLEDTKKSISNLIDAIQQGLLTPSTKQRLDELEETKSNLEISIMQEQMNKPLLTREQLTFWICKFRNIDLTRQESRQRLIDVFINAVYVYDDHAVITFNYKDGTKTVSLAEVEASEVGSSLSSYGEPYEKA